MFCGLAATTTQKIFKRYDNQWSVLTSDRLTRQGTSQREAARDQSHHVRRSPWRVS
jgi:hypothetical protein